MIPTNEISIVVQGPVVPVTQAVLASVRAYLPGATLILSTWQGSNADGLDYDRLVLSTDPGGFPSSDRPGAGLNNVNRQLVSTLAGLQQVTTPYAFKLRTDFLLTGNHFLDYFGQFTAGDPAYRLFTQRLLACSYFTRNPHRVPAFAFHPSDLAFFGTTADMLRLFSIPLMPESEARWPKPDGRYGNRYAAEQYLFLTGLRQNGHAVACDDGSDSSAAQAEETDRYLVHNFVLLGFEQFNLAPTKSIFRMAVHPTTFACCYTHYDWLTLYRRHADPAFALPPHDDERTRIDACVRRYRKYRLLANLVTMWFPTRTRKKHIRHAMLERFLHRA